MMSFVSLSHPEWDVSIKSYVLRTNYEEYAVILMKKTSNFGPTTTLKLYGMSAVALWASKLWGGLSNTALWLWSWCLQSTLASDEVEFYGSA